MLLLRLNFELRNQFVELNNLFSIFNNMILSGDVSSTDIEVKDFTENYVQIYYLHIGLHRCKSSFPSVGIERDLMAKPSTELLCTLKQLAKMKDDGDSFEPYFSVGKDSRSIYIDIYDKIDPNMLHAESLSFEQILDCKPPRLLSLDFHLRKPFKSLPELIAVANGMYEHHVSSFITLRPTHDNKKHYLNIVFPYATKQRPSLFLTVGLVRGSISDQYQLQMAKFNFACSSIPNMSPVFIRCIDTDDSRWGPILQLDVFESTDPKTKADIEKQFSILDTIAP